MWTWRRADPYPSIIKPMIIGTLQTSSLTFRSSVMKINKLTAITAAALMMCSSAASCSDKKTDTGSASSVSEGSPTESLSAPENTIDESISGDNYDSDAYYEKILERLSDDEASDEPFEFGQLSDIVTPGETDPDAELGSYYISSDGVMLYYEQEEFPTELILTLKEYFQAFSHSDYTSYTRCIYPSYIDEMNTYLNNDFGYDLKTSFATQCSSLADNTFGDYIVTRLKIEPAPQYVEGVDNIQSYFELLNNSFNKDYYSEVIAEADNMYDAVFYIMAQDAYSEETLLISEYEVVFAEKDGRFYLFG